MKSSVRRISAAPNTSWNERKENVLYIFLFIILSISRIVATIFISRHQPKRLMNASAVAVFSFEVTSFKRLVET